MKKMSVAIIGIVGYVGVAFGGAAMATPLSGSWGDDVVVDADVLSITINPSQSFFQTADYHGGWFLLDNTADSITMSAEVWTWDATPYDVYYGGIVQENPGNFSTGDFLANSTVTFSGISWMDMTIETGKISEQYFMGVDYDNTQPLWGFAVWDTQSQPRSDNLFGSGGQVTFVENMNPVPEPATMLLFGAGLIGLVGVNRKKKS